MDRTTAEDQWFYLDGNAWRQVFADAIQMGKPMLTGEAVMFAYNGLITCFFPADSDDDARNPPVLETEAGCPSATAQVRQV